MKIPESDLKLVRAEQAYIEKHGFSDWWCPAKKAFKCEGPRCPRFRWAGQPEFKENWAECEYGAYTD